MTNFSNQNIQRWMPWVLLAVNLGLILLVALISPADQILGTNVRVVYLHGSIVSVAMMVMGLSAGAGLLALIFRKRFAWLHSWSQALMRTGLLYWLIQLPLSLLSMQLNWGGLYLDEPRWQVSLTYAVVGLLLQVALFLFQKPQITSLVNLLYGVILIWAVSNVNSVMHPQSVISQSSQAIQIYFFMLVILDGLAAGQLAMLCKKIPDS